MCRTYPQAYCLVSHKAGLEPVSSSHWNAAELRVGNNFSIHNSLQHMLTKLGMVRVGEGSQLGHENGN